MTHIDERINTAVDNLFVACTAKVIKLNSNGTVDIRINERQKFTANTWSKNRGILTNVPVALFKFGAFEIVAPIANGDNVIVLFLDGDVNSELFDQVDERRHFSSNALVIHGIRNTNTGYSHITHYAVKNNGKDIFKITPNGSEVIIDAKLTVTGDINCSKTVTASTDCVGGGISLKSHKHPGVQSGAAQTGTPV